MADPASSASLRFQPSLQMPVQQQLHPVSSLHRHGVESLLGWLELRELNAAAQTCHAWSAAAGSMAPLAAVILPKRAAYLPMESVVCSSLARHLVQLCSLSTPLCNVSPQLLSLLAERLR
jgi:hypothetical protein